MLRSPVEALKAHKLESIATIAVVMVAMILPGVLAIFVSMNQGAITQWLERYRPIVYLADHVSPQQEQDLADEISGWVFVASVQTREPVQALKQLQERLGAERVLQLGITESMLPRSFVLEPSVPLVGHIELVSRVAGLEARQEIHAVDVPDVRALKPLAWARAGMILAALLAIVLSICAVLAVVTYLRRLEARERQELELLEVFGASLVDMRHPSWVRGLVIGAVSGTGSLIFLGLGTMIWHYYQSSVLGASFLLTSWLILLGVLVGGLCIGGIGGWVVTRVRKAESKAQEGPLTRSLLLWEQAS